MKAQEIINRLHSVKQTGRNEWKACCPAHEDRTPSLSIKETDDGVIVIHCFAGCGAIEVLNSIGMDYSDLYPDQNFQHSKPRPKISIRVAYDILQMEGLVLFHIAKAIERGEPVEADRLLDCLARIQKVNLMLMPS